MRIDQFLPNFAPRDAIGNHVLQVRTALRQAGFQSDIWAEAMFGGLEAEARPYQSYPPPGSSGADVLLYHASTHSPMASWLPLRPEPLVLYYHNITPSRYFTRWEPVAAAGMERARVELRRLAPDTALALAASAYNAAELVDVGFRRVVVSPLLVDFDTFDLPPEPRARHRPGKVAAGGSNWLFVGRVAPNKCQHDVIGAFAAYRRLFDAGAHLTLVGGMTSRLYFRALQQLIDELDLGDSVELADSLPPRALLACYRRADIFVCLSEHEGFCVPVVEAMHLGVPVVAFAAAALPDTVADAGVLLEDKDPLMVACAVDRVLHDGALRATMVRAGHARADHFSLRNTSKLLVEVLSEFTQSVEDRH